MHLTNSFRTPTFIINGEFVIPSPYCNAEKIRRAKQATNNNTQEKTASSHKISSLSHASTLQSRFRTLCKQQGGQHKSIQLHDGCERMHFSNGKKGFPVVLRFHSVCVACEWMKEWINERSCDNEKEFLLLCKIVVAVLKWHLVNSHSVEQNINAALRYDAKIVRVQEPPLYLCLLLF